jgi:hypothetical protein
VAKLAKMVICVGLLGLYLVVCATWYIEQTPIRMTAEQETAIIAGETESSDCDDGVGGCEKESKPADVEMTPCSNPGGLCTGLSWSTDDTKNRVCTSVTYSVFNWDCYATNPHQCQRTFAKCIDWMGMGVLRCANTTNANSGQTATKCVN